MKNVNKYIALLLSMLIFVSIFTMLPSVSAKTSDEHIFCNSKIAIDDEINPTEKIYKIESMLDNVVTNNDQSEIKENDTYQAILKPVDNYEIISVSVKMDNKDLKICFQPNICIINIQAVDSNISIVASAERKKEPITVTSSTEPTTVTPVTETTTATSATETSTVSATVPTSTTKPTSSTVPSTPSTTNPTSSTVPSTPSTTNPTSSTVPSTPSTINPTIPTTKPTKPITYKITLNANGGKVNKKYIVAQKGQTVTLPKPSKSKYGFKGWYLGNNKKTIYSKVKVSSNITYNALWVSPKVTVKIRNRFAEKNGCSEWIIYNENGEISEWFKYSVNCKEKVTWKPVSKYVNVKNDSKTGKVTFSMKRKPKNNTNHKVDCYVSGKKVFTVNLYYLYINKLSGVKINRTNKNTVSLSWKKANNKDKYLVTITDKNTKRTIRKTLGSNVKSYKYTRLNTKHKYSVSVRLIHRYMSLDYYGDANKKTI